MLIFSLSLCPIRCSNVPNNCQLSRRMNTAIKGTHHPDTSSSLIKTSNARPTLPVICEGRQPIVPISQPPLAAAASGDQHRTPNVNSQSLPHLSAPASSYLSQLASLPPSPPQCKIDQELRCECGACRRERGGWGGKPGRQIDGRNE